MTADVWYSMAIAVLPHLDGSTLILLAKAVEERAVLQYCVGFVCYKLALHTTTVQTHLVVLMHMCIHRQCIVDEIPTMRAKNELHEGAVGKLDFAPS